MSHNMIIGDDIYDRYTIEHLPLCQSIILTTSFFFTCDSKSLDIPGLAKKLFFLFKTKHTVFLNSFFLFKTCFKLGLKKTCFKPILNTNKTALNRLKSLLCCCTFTLDHWACALRSCITILQCKLPNYRNLDFLSFSHVKLV
jgi:hypothetical protein